MLDNTCIVLKCLTNAGQTDIAMKKANKNGQGRTTLGDVATRAGVSVSTASLVLSNKARERRISDEVHRRVQQAADELDYSPNLLVRSMQRGRTQVLSFFNGYRRRWVGDIYWDRFSTTIESAAGKLGYDVLVHCDFSHSAEGTYNFLNGGRADGLLLFAPVPDEPLLPFLRNSRLPVVLTHARDEEDVLSSVTEDMPEGMRLVAERLVTLGHRRIAVITSDLQHQRDAHLRTDALRSHLTHSHVMVPDRWVLPADQPAEFGAALAFLMAEPAPPTALFCWNDRGGYQMLDACKAQGIAVPGQLSLVGYDGLAWPTVTGHVLDSVHVDLERMAIEAVTLLDGLITGKEARSQKVLGVQLKAGTTLQSNGAL